MSEGPLVITDGASLSSVTGSWLSASKESDRHLLHPWRERSMTPAVKSQIEARLR